MTIDRMINRYVEGNKAGEHAAAGETARIGRNPGRLSPTPRIDTVLLAIYCLYYCYV